MNILGIHCGHDSNAALIMDGRIIASIQEERFNRIKHSADPPRQSISQCLLLGGIDMDHIDMIAFSGQRLPDDAHILFDLKHETWEPPAYFKRCHITEGTKIYCYDHHQCHAATAFYLSPSGKPALVMVSDGVGDDCSISFWTGRDASLKRVKKYPDEGSLGWFYSNVTEALGWIHGDGEGKTMAMAASASPYKALGPLAHYCPEYKRDKLVRPRNFGRIDKVVERGAIQWHLPDATSIKGLLEHFSKEELAASAQKLLEDNHMRLCRHWLQETGMSRLCLSGGVFLNIILNRKMAELVPRDQLFVTHNPGDSGLGLGAALCALSEHAPHLLTHGYHSPYLGPGFTDREIHQFLKIRKLRFKQLNQEELCRLAASALADNRCVGWFQGRMESGPRALGNRSILMSPLNPVHQEYINRFVKYREPFRPFCPSILAEERQRYLVEHEDAPYMILAFTAPEEIRSQIRAVVHLDGTIRPQIVDYDTNPLFHNLLRHFRELTGHGILLNTSFNIRGEPIVTSLSDAVRCFYSTGLDMLVLGSFVLSKQ